MRAALKTDECLICHAPLVYFEKPRTMECQICHRDFQTNACCVNGHFVCDECHTRGMDAIVGVCLSNTSRDPLEVLEELMSQPFCHMHGPEHHTIVGAALLTAYRNAGGNVDLSDALDTMLLRGRQVPGGICGMWGSCGAAISAGIFVSIVTISTPLESEAFGLANTMTSRALAKIGAVGGPRCCKRDSYLAILEAVQFTKEHLGVSMGETYPACTRIAKNRQCIGNRCPFTPANVARRDAAQAVSPTK